jgi:hypothetical protein
MLLVGRALRIDALGSELVAVWLTITTDLSVVSGPPIEVGDGEIVMIDRIAHDGNLLTRRVGANPPIHRLFSPIRPG